MTMDLGEGHERVTLEGNPTSIHEKILYRRFHFYSIRRLAASFLAGRNEAIDGRFFVSICSNVLQRFVTIEGWPRWRDDAVTRGEKENEYARSLLQPLLQRRHNRCRANRSSIGKESCTAKSESHCEPGSASQVT